MPTYEYVCQTCKHQFEEFQSITAKPLRKCPEYGKPRLKRLIGTGAGVIFKGSGFYETDYRSESYKKSAKAETESGKKITDDSAKGNGSDSKKSDTKPTASSAESTSAKPDPKNTTSSD